MDHQLLNSKVQDFIWNNTSADLSKLAFIKNPFPEIEFREIINQISARSKAKDKLPTWFNSADILYPPTISIEQASSEITARYKAQLVSGKSLIDLTGGFGVDDFYFSKVVTEVTYCEINSELAALVSHNSRLIGASNISCESGDSTSFLKKSSKEYDWIYIDPSRRSDIKGKVFLLKDCLPDVSSLLDFYLSFSRNILIKTAPILDITAGLSELKHVKEIHVVAIQNEVKELLWVISKAYNGNPRIVTVNMVDNETSDFNFTWGEDKREPVYGVAANYLYEPNAAIMKSGGFIEIGLAYNLRKLHQHSHLYTSDILLENFPGRSFKIETSFPYNKSGMKSFLQGTKANVTVRNFPESVETLRKKWKIADGGNSYCFFTTNIANEKIVLLCSKI